MCVGGGVVRNVSPFDLVAGVYFGFRFESRLSKGPVLHVRIHVTNTIGNGGEKKGRKKNCPEPFVHRLAMAIKWV